jgi:hypothetical protein
MTLEGVVILNEVKDLEMNYPVSLLRGDSFPFARLTVSSLRGD